MPPYQPMQPPPNWVPPPFKGPPPIPTGVNPQQWQAGFWQYNPAYNYQRAQQQQQQYVPWIPSRHWGERRQQQQPPQQQPQQPQQSQQPQQPQQQQQQQQPSSQSHNPYKRVPRPPSAEYLASRLSDNPLGLSNMIPAVDYDQSQLSPEEVHTPWIWNPAELAYDKDESSTPSRPAQLKRHATDPAIGTSPPAEDQEPESFTSKRDLQPTFSPNIVRTPKHYRRDSSSVTPSPSRSSGSHSSDSQLSSRMAQLSTSPTRQSSAPSALYSSAMVPPQPPMLTDRISEEPASMLSPLVIAASTPKPTPSSLRTVRNHHSYPGVIQQPLSTIPETPSAPISKKSSEHLLPKTTHANTLPSQPKSQGPLTYVAYPAPSQPSKARDRETRAGSRHTTTAFIDPPSPLSPRSPSPRRRVRPSSTHASPVRRGGNDSPNNTPPNTYGDSPPVTSASHSHSRRSNINIFIPPPTPPPDSYDIRIRRGYWNRRGDHLTKEGYLVYAPTDKAYPPELITYPPENEGYQDEKGSYTKYVARPELPESLPRHGKPSEYPYDVFVTYDYM